MLAVTLAIAEDTGWAGSLSANDTVCRDDGRFILETLATYDRQGNSLSTILERMIKRTDQGVQATAQHDIVFFLGGLVLSGVLVLCN